MTTDNRYLRLIRQDCPLPPGTHVVVYCRDSGGDKCGVPFSERHEFWVGESWMSSRITKLIS